jgi:hypothetical protein
LRTAKLLECHKPGHKLFFNEVVGAGAIDLLPMDILVPIDLVPRDLRIDQPREQHASSPLSVIQSLTEQVRMRFERPVLP